MIKIQLDANALTALFPAGTEAYLALQQACLTEAAKRAIRAMSTVTLQAMVHEMSTNLGKQIREELIAEFGPKVHNYRSNEFDIDLKPAIREKITNEVHSKIKSAMDSYIETYGNAMLRRKIGELADKTVSDKLSEILDGEELNEKIKEKLKQKLKELL